MKSTVPEKGDPHKAFSFKAKIFLPAGWDSLGDSFNIKSKKR
jgi:hypothetical protein